MLDYESRDQPIKPLKVGMKQISLNYDWFYNLRYGFKIYIFISTFRTVCFLYDSSKPQKYSNRAYIKNCEDLHTVLQLSKNNGFQTYQILNNYHKFSQLYKKFETVDAKNKKITLPIYLFCHSNFLQNTKKYSPRWK